MKADFDQFIGIFDGVFDENFCDGTIDHFKYVEKMGKTVTRDQTNNAFSIQIDDTAYCPYDEWDESIRVHNFAINKGFIDGMNACLEAYVQKYSALTISKPIEIQSTRIQKTVPGGGYHAWHSEHGAKDVHNRVLACSVYLNDVQNGGETEFLYQRQRVPAQKGRALIWPAGFTHTHRGNPPLSNTKYLMTSWFEYI